MAVPDFPKGEEIEKGIFFYCEDVDFEIKDESRTVNWLRKIIEQEGHKLHLLNFIFCSDDYLLQLNQEYLEHDTLTDVITFPYQAPPIIEGDIFISIERVKDNAGIYRTAFDQELQRVMAHGLLHLCGFGDKKPDEIVIMRMKEDEALQLRRHFDH